MRRGCVRSSFRRVRSQINRWRGSVWPLGSRSWCWIAGHVATDVRPNIGGHVFGRLDLRVRSPWVSVQWGGNGSISFDPYINVIASHDSLSWSFLLRIHPSEPSHSSPTHLAWLIHHLVRLESIQVHCFEWLHLKALGDCVLLRDSLVTLGGCRHLDGLVQRGSSSGGWCLSLAPIVVIVGGSWPFFGREPKDTLVDCSWLVDPHLVLVVWHPIAG
jgi:hypothetical protein